MEFRCAMRCAITHFLPTKLSFYRVTDNWFLENMLDVVLVTVVSIELQTVRKILEKAGCASFPDFQIRDIQTKCWWAVWLPICSCRSRPLMFRLLQMGHLRPTNFLQAIKLIISDKSYTAVGRLWYMVAPSIFHVVLHCSKLRAFTRLCTTYTRVLSTAWQSGAATRSSRSSPRSETVDSSPKSYS